MFQQHPKPLCGARFVVPNSGSALKTGSLPQPRNKWQSPCLLAPLSAAGPPCAYIAATTVQWMGPCWDKRRHFCVCGSATAWVAGIALSCHTLQKHFETKPQRLLINAPISLGKKTQSKYVGPKGFCRYQLLEWRGWQWSQNYQPLLLPQQGHQVFTHHQGHVELTIP